MDREQAQHILQLCRPDNAEDRADPLLAQALQLLHSDAELRAWFEAQQAFDRQISDALQQIEPPADLQTCILAGMRAHHAQAEHSQAEHSIPFDDAAARRRARPWFKPAIGIAAAIALLLTLLARPIPQASTQRAAQPILTTASVPNIIEFLADEISAFKASKFDKRDTQLDELQRHLAQAGMPTPHCIPEQLDSLPTMGCVTLDYQGTKLSMICFSNGQIYHLITADKASFPAHCSQHPQIFECQQQTFKIWTEANQVMILCTAAGAPQALRCDAACQE